MARIAHVISTPSGLGGAERVMIAVAKAAAANGDDQLILNPFTLDPAGSVLREISGSIPYSGRACSTYSAVPSLRRWLRTELAAFRPDVIHTHLFHALVVVGSLRHEARTVLTHHHGDLLKVRGRNFEQALDRRFGKRFDRVVAVSGSVEKFLLESYRYPRAKVVRIDNGWEGHPTGASGKVALPTVVCTANFREEKGHDVLLRAFATVLRSIPQAHLVLVGEGPLHSDLERQAGSLGISSSVEFVGSVADVWPFLEAAHVYTLPSRYETRGISVMEAMAAGLPVVATSVGGVPELVEPGVTGELVPPNDADALAAKTIELLKDGNERRRMGEAGRAAVGALNMKATVDRYLALYDEIRDT